VRCLQKYYIFQLSTKIKTYPRFFTQLYDRRFLIRFKFIILRAVNATMRFAIGCNNLHDLF